ncbi:hypothetical protein TcarDRAFT_0452 [Thermosinus carboxydivorans Nor1]|uniref:Uncharacterized protein n=1 Tax=Thermosinus carboxydivorans Nor1 TaxID=401526 RepID=A1HTD6_9FIRM|nr:hypothetical protein [Thermosinus carboxydivorans]EAX46685.1 hypothetical protein TcarDRAFT_0452 [Thermosinus carboxydivorans Nor1]
MMSVEKQVRKLCKQLIRLGYYPFQIRSMMQEAIGTVIMDDMDEQQQKRLVNVLQKYVELGNDFLLSYSK